MDKRTVPHENRRLGRSHTIERRHIEWLSEVADKIAETTELRRLSQSDALNLVLEFASELEPDFMLFSEARASENNNGRKYAPSR